MPHVHHGEWSLLGRGWNRCDATRNPRSLAIVSYGLWIIPWRPAQIVFFGELFDSTDTRETTLLISIVVRIRESRCETFDSSDDRELLEWSARTKFDEILQINWFFVNLVSKCGSYVVILRKLVARRFLLFQFMKLVCFNYEICFVERFERCLMK